MRILSRAIASFAIITAAMVSPLTPSASAQDTGEAGTKQTFTSPRTTVGIEGGYVSRNTSAYAGVYMRYRVSRVFAIKPRFDFVLRHKDDDAWMFNLDTHYLLPLHSGPCEVYGILGAGLESWNVPELSVHDEGARVTRRRHSSLGFDVGAGAAYNISSTLRLALEAKANLTARYSTALIGVSIGYNF